jgi:hypothetical protein
MPGDLGVFQSDHHQIYKRTFKEPKAEYQKNDFTRQFEGGRAVSGDETIARHRGLANTKFGVGFQRRREGDITNPITQDNAQAQQAVESRKQYLANSRSQKLVDESVRSGFNMLTGETRGRGPVPVHEGKKFIDVNAYKEARRCSALTVLKNSGGRYHAIEEHPPPHPNAKPSTISLY